MAASTLTVINRALQKVGAQGQATSLTQLTPRGVVQAVAMYDSIRQAEQQRNMWRFCIRKNALRAISWGTKFLTFATWSNVATYAIGDIILGSDGQIYQSNVAANLNNDPTIDGSTAWTLYFGPDVAFEYVTTWVSTITYNQWNHAVGSDGNVYVSLINNNLNNNPVSTVGTDWQIATTENANDMTQPTSGTTFYAGELLYVGNVVYLSLYSNNAQDPTVTPNWMWLVLTAQPALANPNILYPLGAGPIEQQTTQNVYRLPVGFLKEAPQDPLAPARPRVWRLENNYIVTADIAPIVYRYAANVKDATQFHALFIEGMACRLGVELCEILTQSAAKLQALEGEYKTFMTDARIANAIETGPVDAQEDDWLTVKVSGAYSPFQYS